MAGSMSTWRLVDVVLLVVLVIGLNGRQTIGRQPECSQVTELLKSLFPGHNSQDRVDASELEVCSGAGSGGAPVRSCCTRSTERHLHQLAVNDAFEVTSSLRAWRELGTIEQLITKYRDNLHQQLLATANFTSDMLNQTFQFTDADCQGGCIAKLFSDVSEYFSSDSKTVEAFDFQKHVSRMLDSLFATVYFRYVQQGGTGGHRSSTSSSLHSRQQHQHFQQQQLYIACLASNRRQLSPTPFTDIEDQLSKDMERSMNLTRLMLEALDLAVDTISWTTRGPKTSISSTANGSLLNDLLRSHQCSRALMRLRHCALCDGFAQFESLRPCKPFCLNVARGCLAPLVVGEGGGLGQTWNLFVNGAAQLANSIRGSNDIDRVLADFVPSIILNIGHWSQTLSSINSSQISSKCGHYVGIHKDSQHSGSHHHNGGSSDVPTPPNVVAFERIQLVRNRIPKVMMKLRHTTIALTQTNTFFTRLPDALCRHEELSLADTGVCWNGTAFDRYNQTVVQMTAASQLNGNPEMKVAAEPPARIAALTKRLGDMTKLLHSRMPPRSPHTIHALIPEAEESSSYSGDDDYDYGFNDNYPPDDEDGYGSGSGSAESSDSEITDTDDHSTIRPPYIVPDKHSTTTDEFIFFTTMSSTHASSTTPTTKTTKTTTTPTTTRMTTTLSKTSPHGTSRKPATHRPPEKPLGGTVIPAGGAPGASVKSLLFVTFFSISVTFSLSSVGRQVL